MTLRHIGFSEDLSYPQQLAAAAEVERLGYAGMWTNENRTRDAFVTTALWASVTSRLLLGIGVTPAPIRTPHAIALGALSAQEASSGRLLLGIGSGVRVTARAQWGIETGPPMIYMRDLLTALAPYLQGKPVTYDGPSLRLANAAVALTPQPPKPPIFVGALGPRMVEIAGELAEGALLNWATPDRIRSARNEAAIGAARSGRDASSFQLAGYVRVCVDDDAETARAAAATQAVFYAANPVYAAQFRAMGFADEVDYVARAARDLGGKGAIAAMPDSLLREVVAFGPPAAVRERYDALSHGLDIPIARIIPTSSSLDSFLFAARALAPA